MTETMTTPTSSGSKLIPPERCTLRPYFTDTRGVFVFAGCLVITPHVPDPDWKTWELTPYNRFCTVCTNGFVDGAEVSVIPVFLNSALTSFVFDTEKGTHEELNRTKPAIAFFLGNDDWSYGLRFSTFEERDRMLAEFGEELGFLKELQGHN